MHSNHVIPAFFKYSTAITIQVSIVDGFLPKSKNLSSQEIYVDFRA